jgi:superoxide reductase
MAKQNTWYKCEICSNIVAVVNAGAGELICCGKPMDEMKVKSVGDEGYEKHVPIVTIDGDKVHVKIGEIPHPMEDAHHLQVVQIIRDGVVVEGKRLYPGHETEITFILEETEGIKVRVICNIHGLWMN